MYIRYFLHFKLENTCNPKCKALYMEIKYEYDSNFGPRRVPVPCKLCVLCKE